MQKQLVDQLYHWWICNGWSPKTLQDKSTKQLFAIKKRAEQSSWAIKSPNKMKYLQ